LLRRQSNDDCARGHRHIDKKVACVAVRSARDDVRREKPAVERKLDGRHSHPPEVPKCSNVIVHLGGSRRKLLLFTYEVPEIRLSGAWLERIGFPKGARYLISVEREFRTIILQGSFEKGSRRR
jgi:hypothetical protein